MAGRRLDKCKIVPRYCAFATQKTRCLLIACHGPLNDPFDDDDECNDADETEQEDHHGTVSLAW